MERTSRNEIQIEFIINNSQMGSFNIEWNFPFFPSIGDKIEFLNQFLSDSDKFNVYQLHTAFDEFSYLAGAASIEDEKVSTFYGYLCPFQVKLVEWRKDKFSIYPILVLGSYKNE